MRIVNRWRASTLVAAFAVASTHAISASALDDRVYKLYASAEYAQALEILAESTEPEAHLYRALCFVGLERHDEAQTALQGLVNAAPDFEVSSEEMPPRVLKLLAETRRQLLPGILRRMFADARERYHADQREQARPLFERVVSVSSRADIRDIEVVADMRVLAEGFLDLIEAPRTGATIAADPPTSASAVPGQNVTPPVVVKQTLPAWPSTLAPVTVPATGAVRVRISKTGTVTGAAIVTGIHPQYDSRVLASARSWEYKPATMNGVPVDSESVVQIRVNPAPAQRARP